MTAPALPADIRDWPRSDKEMSNCDHSIDAGLDDDLRAGMTAPYFGWNFCCNFVWFHDGLFHAAVFCYHQLREVVSAGSLGDLMGKVSDSYGWD